MPNAWLEMVETTGNGESPREALSREEQAIEFLLFGLRLSEGISAERYEALSGVALPRAKLDELCDLGLIQVEQGRIASTAAGRPVLNGILRELIP